jgi:catechol 2,3-dioxygenase-like lactoylglutathione lyase family enzyme
MRPRLTVITLGVDDLQRALEFYRDGLGLKTQGVSGEEFEHGAVAFFELESGLTLALWPRASIAHDTGLQRDGRSATEFTLGHNVPSREVVDSVMATARAAGAVIVKEATDTFWGGYAGYFQDLDGHVWEVVWNPQMRSPDEATRHRVDSGRCARVSGYSLVLAVRRFSSTELPAVRTSSPADSHHRPRPLDR